MARGRAPSPRPRSTASGVGGRPKLLCEQGGVALRAELRQQAAALKQAQRDTASLAQQLRAATTS